MGMLYLIHFQPAYKHARHYLGFTKFKDVEQRLADHQAGKGSKLTRVALRAGCKLMLAWRREGTRTEERRLKRNSHVCRTCPFCLHETLQSVESLLQKKCKR